MKTACSLGKYSTGLTASNINTCISCPEGSYSSATAAVSSSTCNSCPDGYWSTTGSSFCNLPCGVGYFCTGGVKTACISGTYSSATTASSILTCVNCNVGKYSSTPAGGALSSCLNCPDGKWSQEGSTACELNCGGGYWCTGGVKTACVVGKFSSSLTAASISTCITCNPGFYCLSTSDSQTKCQTGR